MTLFVGNSTVNSSINFNTASLFTNSTSTALFVASNGNIGIATASPGNKLSIGSTASTSTATPDTMDLGGTFRNTAGGAPKLRVWTDGTNHFGIGISSGQMEFTTTQAAASQVWYTAGTEKMRLLANGNLGIGTASPTSTLDVRGNVSIPSDSLSFGTTVRQMINLWSTAYGIGIQNNTQYFRTASRFSWFAGGVHSATENDPGSGGAVAMTLTNGNLSVYSGATQYPTTLILVPSTHATSRRAAIGIGDWTPLQDINGNGTRDFTIYNSSSGIHGLTIRTDGNVGIGGTTSAAYKLQVTGASGTAQIYASSSDASYSRIGLSNSNRHWTLTNYGTSFSPNGRFAIADESAAAVRFTIDTDGIVTNFIESRAPIFYNSGDTNVRWSTNDFVLRGGSPTIWFRDTDHNSAMIHCNSNLLYILRGGTDTESWSQVNGVWPFYINLTNNDATFGGSIFTSLGSMYAKRFYDNDNTAYFVDPADTSVFNAISMYGPITGRTDTAANVSAANDTGSMSIRGSTTAPATVSFHRAGAYAINMGLDTDNIFKIGGWSDGANTYRLQLQGPGGTHTFNGNVTLTGALTVQTGGGTITGGFIVAPGNLGTISSGTTTLSAASGNYQYYTNNGAHTIAAPGSDCAIDVLVTNGASAGAITLSGFTAPSGGGGDTYATTNTQRFILMVRRINGISTYSWKALQ